MSPVCTSVPVCTQPRQCDLGKSVIKPALYIYAYSLFVYIYIGTFSCMHIYICYICKHTYITFSRVVYTQRSFGVGAVCVFGRKPPNSLRSVFIKSSSVQQTNSSVFTRIPSFFLCILGSCVRRMYGFVRTTSVQRCYILQTRISV